MGTFRTRLEAENPYEHKDFVLLRNSHFIHPLAFFSFLHRLSDYERTPFESVILPTYPKSVVGFVAAELGEKYVHLDPEIFGFCQFLNPNLLKRFLAMVQVFVAWYGFDFNRYESEKLQLKVKIQSLVNIDALGNLFKIGMKELKSQFMDSLGIKIEPDRILERLPLKELYLLSNHKKSFVSIDLRSANFNILRILSPEIFFGEPSWQSFLKKTNPDISPFLLATNRLRQVILGKLAPIRIRRLERFLMRLIWTELSETHGCEILHAFFHLPNYPFWMSVEP